MSRRIKTCSVPGCGPFTSHGSKDLCGKHWYRLKTYGNLETRLRKPRAPNGAGTINESGYRNIQIKGKKIVDHIVIAERALGRALQGKEEVHHFNEIKTDNRNDNLVICPNRAYHALLHVRQQALRECGDANKRKCVHCKTYGQITEMKPTDKGRKFGHYKCLSDYWKTRWAKLKIAKSDI